MSLVSRILLTAVQNLMFFSLDRMEVMVHEQSLQISLNKARTGNIRGADKPVGW